MGDTVDALSYRADVPARARENVAGKVEAVKSKITGASSRVSDAASGATSRVPDVTPGGQDVRRSARRARGIAQENPFGLALGAVAVGFIAGLAVPSTRV